MGRRFSALKIVTATEAFFLGRPGPPPGQPTMPGMLIVESMAQAGGILLMASVEDPGSKLVYFMMIDRVRWRGAVRAGDQLRVELAVTRSRGRVSRVRGVASVDGVVVCSADLAASVVDRR